MIGYFWLIRAYHFKKKNAGAHLKGLLLEPP